MKGRMNWLNVFYIMVLITMHLPHPASSQSNNAVIADTVIFPEIILRDQFFPRWYNYFGNRDSTSIINNALDAGVLLNNYAPIYIRAYGRGMSYSLSVRGSNSAQVEVLWNGIPVNNPMHGQADLSLIKINSNETLLFDPNTYAYGLSGTLAINTSPRRQEGLHLSISEKLSSTRGHELNAAFSLKKEKIGASASLSILNDQNSFSYNFQDIRKRISNNALQQYRANTSIYYQLNPKQKFTIHLFAQDANREIPPSLYENTSDAKQYDKSLRVATNFEHLSTTNAINFRLAATFDDLEYESQLKNIYSSSKAYRIIEQFDWTHVLNDRVNLGVRFDHQFNNVLSNAYTSNPTYNDLFLSLQSEITFSRAHEFKFGIKGGTRSFKKLALAPFVYYRLTISENLHLLFASGRKFRYPSGNDLFWAQGGNQDLKPEYAWENEISFKNQFNEKFVLESRSYHKKAENWIQWLPLDGVFSAQNIDLVRSIGMENSLSFSTSSSDYVFRSSILHQMNFTTYAKGINEGKQLIYKPKHLIKSNTMLGWQKWKFNLNQQYIASVYTTSDLSSELPHFYLLNLSMEYNPGFKKSELVLFAGMKNVLNSTYFTIENYVMPGRIIEAGINYRYDKKNKKILL